MTGSEGAHFRLLDVLREKLPYPELKRAVREQRELVAPALIPIDKASCARREMVEVSRRVGLILAVACFVVGYREDGAGARRRAFAPPAAH